MPESFVFVEILIISYHNLTLDEISIDKMPGNKHLLSCHSNSTGDTLDWERL